MKRAIIILTLVLSSKLYAEPDQKTMQYLQAGTNTAASGMTALMGIEYYGVCVAGTTAVVTAAASTLACWKSGLAFTTAALTATAAGLSLAYGGEMDPNKGSLPSGINTTNTTPPTIRGTTQTPSDLRNTIEAQDALARQKLDDLKSRGYDMDKFMANPEAFGVSKEQLKQMQSEVAQSASKGDSLNPEEAMKTILGESSSVETSGYSRDIATADASVSVSDMESFNFDTLFSGLMPKGALENSAPGYYGNVPLKVLNPGSKMSLFERVSSKMKSLM